MAPAAVVFALANPDPEVDPAEAEKYAAVVASGRSDYPNQINNVLAFPGVFRGLLDARASEITTDMLLRAAEAIALVVKDDELNPNFIIPSVFNPEVPKAVAAAIRGRATAGRRGGRPQLTSRSAVTTGAARSASITSSMSSRRVSIHRACRVVSPQDHGDVDVVAGAGPHRRAVAGAWVERVGQGDAQVAVHGGHQADAGERGIGTRADRVGQEHGLPTGEAVRLLARDNRAVERHGRGRDLGDTLEAASLVAPGPQRPEESEQHQRDRQPQHDGRPPVGGGRHDEGGEGAGERPEEQRGPQRRRHLDRPGRVQAVLQVAHQLPAEDAVHTPGQRGERGPVHLHQPECEPRRPQEGEPHDRLVEVLAQAVPKSVQSSPSLRVASHGATATRAATGTTRASRPARSTRSGAPREARCPEYARRTLTPMAVRETRLLLLGAVAMFEPVNGYQIRRELVSWRVDKWAHVNPGSIYHGLSALTAEGYLTRSDLVDGTREVAVYEVTPAGRALLDEMMVEALESVDPYDRTVFTIAFGMLPLLERPRVLAALVTRRAALEREVDAFVRGKDDPANGPPHARRGWVLWLDLAIAELGWLRETIEEVRSGRLRFALGEDWGWQPPADDPGHQMTLDREKYRALLRR